jgi:hypothetical protein
MAYLLVVMVFAALAGGMLWKPAPPPRFAGLPSSEVPRQIGGYVAPGDDVLAPDVKRQLSAAVPISRTYRNAADTIYFLIIGGTDRTVLHDPRSCYIGGGWQLADYHSEALPGTGISVQSCHALGSDNSNLDVVYFYLEDGKIIDRVTDIRLAMLKGALLGRSNTPVYFLEFSRPYQGRTIDLADHAKLQAFAARMWTQIAPKLMPARN